MQRIALLVLSLTMTMTMGSMVSAQTLASHQLAQVCPKCGKVHAAKLSPSSTITRPGGVVTSSGGAIIQPASYHAPVAANSRILAASGVQNVLAALNAQRARQGVRSLRYDAQLQAVAQRRVQQMAASGLKNHPPGSFAPGRYEGVGWSSSYSPSGVSACYTSDSRMSYAGAAMATGRDGVYFAVVYR
jgi:uncharacterized protein YkwD